MHLQIPFTEIIDIISQKARMNLNINLRAQNQKTVTIHYEQKVKLPFGIEKNIPFKINVVVEKLENETLYLSYDGGVGIDLIVKGIRHVAPDLLSHNSFELLHDSKVVIHLSQIDNKVHDALEQIDVKDIFFNDDGTNIIFSLR